MAIIFAASSTATPPGIAPWVPDKLMHLLAYAGLGVLLLRALSRRWMDRVTPRIGLVAVAIAALYGASDEIHQSFVPGRSMETLDLLADATGAALASSVFWAWGIIGRRHGL
jgi:VanZ family protein